MNEPTSLSEVVERAMTRHGVTSGRALADRSEEQGTPVSYTTINALRKSAYRRRLDRVTREHLAALAGVNPDVVHRLAGAPTARFVLPDSADELEGDQREAVLATVRAFVAANRRAQEQDEPDEPSATSDPAAGTGGHLRAVRDHIFREDPGDALDPAAYSPDEPMQAEREQDGDDGGA